MKKTFLIYLLLIVSIPVLLAQPPEFNFTPYSTSCGIISVIQVNGAPASDSDWIAAFDEDDNCAGAAQLFLYGGQAYCSLQVYGDDPTTTTIDEGINTGETFTFRLWIAATNQILNHPVNIPPVTGWNSACNGAPVPGWDFPDGAVLNFMIGPPPPNDECTGAIPYPGDVENGICVTGYDFSQYTDSGLSPFATCDSGDATGWFTFTAPVTTAAGDSITLQWNAGVNCGIGIDVYETDCSTPLFSCLNNNNGLLTEFIQGNDYLLLLWDDDVGSFICDFCLSIPSPPPPNDECSGAIPYPGDVENGICVTGFDFSAFGDLGQSPVPTCDFGGDSYAWFSWTAPVTTTAGDPLLLSFDAGNCEAGIEFYSTDCLNTVGNCLPNNSGFVNGIIQGDNYLIQIWEDGSGSTNCDFCLSIPPPPPPGDECVDPIQYPGDILNETCVTGFDFTNFNPFTGISPFLNCAGFGQAQVWFTVTTPITTAAGDPISLLFDDGNCDVAIEFYSIDCSSSESICLSFSDGGIISGLTQGTDYLVTMEDALGGGICDFCLTIAPPPPPGEECINPIPYPGDVINGTCLSNINFSLFGNSGNSPLISCTPGGPNALWFSWSAPITSVAGDPINLFFDNGAGQTNNCFLSIEFFDTDCLTPLSNCLSTSSGIVTGLTQGSDYNILVENPPFGTTTCDFCLSIAPPPPPNQECTGAIPYPGDVINGTCITGFNFTIFGDAGQSPVPTCDFGDDSYAWFSWTAPVTTVAGDPLPLSFDAGNCAAGIEFYSTDCLNPVSNCLANNNGFVTGIIQGTDYLIQIWEDGPGSINCDFCLTIPPPPPPGDECSDPIPYPGDVENGVCITGFDFSVFGDFGQSPIPTCDFGDDSYAWFSWTAPVTTTVGDPLLLSFDAGNCVAGIEIYTADCLSAVSNCLGNNSGLVTGVIQGNNYLVQIWEDGPGSSGCDFCLSIAPPPPPGDECFDPIPYPGDILNGTCVTGFDFTAFNFFTGVSPFINCAGFGGAQVWFTVTTPITTVAGDPINLLFNDGICDVAIEFYSIDCSSPASNCLVFSGGGTISGLTQGTDYLVTMEDLFGGGICDFCLAIGPPPPPNDECTGAIPYPGDVANGTCVTGYDFSQYTDSGLSPSATCDGGDATAWFTFTAPIISAAGDPITLEWDDGINCSIGIDVYETDCSTPVPGTCLNNNSGILSNLIQGNDYLLLLWDDGGGSSNCDFCLTIPVIDGCTDTNACNFSPQAGNDDGSCLYVGNSCDDGNPASINDMINSDCTCTGTFPPGCNDIILNGSFETGDFSNWIFTDLYNPFFPNSVDCSGSFTVGFGLNNIDPLSGNCMAVNGFEGSGPGFITLHQEVTIPADIISADFNFSWWVAYDLAYYFANLDRFFEVQILPVGGGAPLAIPYTFTAMLGTIELGTGWTNVNIDLSAFAGQTVAVCFVETITEYFTAPAQVAIDNVSLVACTEVVVCEEEINGAIMPYDPACDVSGIDIVIMAPDGTSVTVTTGADGTFSVPGGPFPCGEYTAAFADPSILPVCFTTTGSTDPIAFTVDGEGSGDDGPFFFSNPEIPTLSQWGLISLALLMMVFGALKLTPNFVMKDHIYKSSI